MHLWDEGEFRTDLKGDTRSIVRWRGGSIVRRWPVARDAEVWLVHGPLRSELAISIPPALRLDIKPEGVSGHLLLVARGQVTELAAQLGEALSVPVLEARTAQQSESAPPIPTTMPTTEATEPRSQRSSDTRELVFVWMDNGSEVLVSLQEDGRVSLSRGTGQPVVCQLWSRHGLRLVVLQTPSQGELCSPIQGDIPHDSMRSTGYGFGDQIVLYRGPLADCIAHSQELAQLLRVRVETHYLKPRDLTNLACPRCDDPDCPRGSICSAWSN